MDGKLVVILDFEAIVSSISPETGLRVNDIEQIGERSRSEDPILIAEGFSVAEQSDYGLPEKSRIRKTDCYM